MPRTIVKCRNCKLEIPAKETKQGLAHCIMIDRNTRWLFCVKCVRSGAVSRHTKTGQNDLSKPDKLSAHEALRQEYFISDALDAGIGDITEEEEEMINTSSREIRESRATEFRG